MASIVYDGDKVNDSIYDLKTVSNRFPNIINKVQRLTGSMISCKGFDCLGSSVTSTSFSDEINNCGIELDGLVSNVRSAQINILSYSNEEDDIQAFLDGLDRNEYKSLDLRSIESSIGVGRKIKNGFTSLAATIFTVGAGLAEGVCNFAETGADLVVLAKSACKTIFADSDEEKQQIWNEAKVYVAEKRTEDAFDRFYNENEFGKNVKNNAYWFDSARGISSGLGYTAGVIGVSAVTGGLASGLGFGAAGSVGTLQLASTAGLMGFSSGTEDAWADGASVKKGLMYGAANGIWEGTQWAIGAKINQYGGIGDQIASGIFKGGKSGAVTRVVLDTVDSGIEGFVQPGLKMIYKDYEGDTFADKYQKAFQDAGGWSNVKNQAIMGGIMSAGSEFIDARKILKSNSKSSAAPANADISTAKALVDDSNVEYRTAMVSDTLTSKKVLVAGVAAAGDFARKTNVTIDGKSIKLANTEFNTSTCIRDLPDGSVKFSDGSYVPSNAKVGTLMNLENNYYNGKTFSTLLESKKETLSGLDYTKFKDASEIFASHGKVFNMNELKLIIYHSEGSVSRIKNALSISDNSLNQTEIDLLSKELANKLFPRTYDSKYNIARRIDNSLVVDLQLNDLDLWKNGDQILRDLYTVDMAIKNKNASTYDTRLSQIRKMNTKGELSENILKEIAASDGYPDTIMKILKEQTSLPLDRRILITEGVASRVFKFENAARLKAQGEILDCNYASATKLVSNIGDSLFDQTIELFKSSETFSQKAKRFVYYNAIDTAISSGLSKNAAIQQVKLMYGSAMDSLGSKTSKASAEQLFKSNLDFFGCSNDIFSQFKDTSLSHGRPSSYIKNKYIGNDGVFHRTKLASDFDRFINSLNDSDIPSYVNVENIANYKSSSARKIFSQAYNDVLLGNVDGNPKDVAKVIAKILELSEDGKKIYIYNNGGKTCSHSQSLSINLCNLTIDGKDLGSIYHETGHFLYGNVLNKKLPDNFLSVRQKALDTLYSSSNEELLKTFKKNVEEVKIYSDYRVTKELNNFATSRGYKSISDYKNHLIDKYSQLNSSQRVKMLQTQNKLNGGFYEDELSRKINDVIDAEQFANLEIRSTKRKISDIISRSFDSYVKVTGMIDSLTMSKENIWYGHSENYFKSFSNPKLISYDEMVADYTALRVNGSNDVIGFLRQLFGNEMMDALEQTYQEMLS